MKHYLRKTACIALSLSLALSSTLCLSVYAANQPIQLSAETVNTVPIIEQSGWFESAYIKWTALKGVSDYKVYVKPVGGSYTQLDTELCRTYPDYFRADAVGLPKGSYIMKVVPVINGAEDNSKATETDIISVDEYLREGYAFSSKSPMGYTNGAYNNDGSLKKDATVLYVTDDNKDTLTINGDSSQGVGLSAIMAYRSKKKSTTPLNLRLIGKVGRPANIDTAMLKFENTQNVTIEGIGDDATCHSWGLTFKRTSNVEVRNIAIMWYGGGSDGDSLSLDTENKNYWIHNCDFFYGEPGGDADQVKGDGSIDTKSRSDYITVSYNHFWDSGKALVSGGVWEAKNPDNPEAKIFLSFHHNWFDHADSRMVRCVAGSTHIYNNYYDGVAKYGVGAAVKSSVFVENNYFEYCPRPMLIATQGSDVYQSDGTYSSKGTLSGQTGGMIKSYGNYFGTIKRYIPYNSESTEYSVDFDAYEASSRDEKVPETVKAKLGGSTYNNFDTSADMYSYTPDSAAECVDKVKSYSGRINGGDFKWSFGPEQNSNSNVIPELQDAVKNYTSKLVKLGVTDNSAIDTTVTASSSTEATTSETSTEVTTGITETSTEITTLSTETTTETTTVNQKSIYKHSFTDSDKSSDFYTIEGDLSTSKGNITYKDKTYSKCLKMGSSTSIKFKSVKKGTLTLVFNPADKKCNCKINGTAYSADENGILTLSLDEGSYEITKKDSCNLYYIEYAADEVKYMYGDADNNKIINLSDAVLTLQYVLRKEAANISDEVVPYLDIDKDGEITSKDAAMILQNVLDSSYSIGN